MSLNTKSLAMKAIISAKKRLSSFNRAMISNYDEVISIIKNAINNDDIAS